MTQTLIEQYHELENLVNDPEHFLNEHFVEAERLLDILREKQNLNVNNSDNANNVDNVNNVNDEDNDRVDYVEMMKNLNNDKQQAKKNWQYFQDEFDFARNVLSNIDSAEKFINNADNVTHALDILKKSILNAYSLVFSEKTLTFYARFESKVVDETSLKCIVLTHHHDFINIDSRFNNYRIMLKTNLAKHLKPKFKSLNLINIDKVNKDVVFSGLNTTKITDLSIDKCFFDQFIFDNNFSKITRLEFVETEIQMIPDFTFSKCKSLKNLIMTKYESDTKMSDNSFAGLDKLEYFELSFNNTSTLPNIMFSHFKKIKYIVLEKLNINNLADYRDKPVPINYDKDKILDQNNLVRYTFDKNDERFFYQVFFYLPDLCAFRIFKNKS